MLYSKEEVFDFIAEEDVKFIRLAFCDIMGNQKNVSVMPSELERAFTDGISVDASAIDGFGCIESSDLLIFPIPSTLNVLPWRPSHGKVVRMFCELRHPDGTPFECDTRMVLKKAAAHARDEGLDIKIGPEMEFYLFKTDESGERTSVPFDNAGYMDVSPEDKGENVRRDICLTLIDMGIQPESSHHEEGPGQNEIAFRYSDPLTSADNTMNFITAVKASAQRAGLYADFSPKPLPGKSGSGMHINVSVKPRAVAGDKLPSEEELSRCFMAGILAHIREITAFLDPSDESYLRLGEMKAPRYVAWSRYNRSALIRIPAGNGDSRRMELRSPDPTANPYLAFALIIEAGIDGVKNRLDAGEEACANLFESGADYPTLPESLEEAKKLAAQSALVSRVLTPGLLSRLTDSAAPRTL